jgi:hypothetical protein
VQYIQDSGNTLASDWMEEAYRRNSRSNESEKMANWSEIFKRNLETIAQADVIIAEASYDSFGVGYQVAFSVQHKKPVLLLHHEDADYNVFASGVEDGWVVHKKYNDDTLAKIIEEFLDDNDIRTKDMRFNFFIDRKIYNYLRWAALRTGKTKAEILRELVQQEIDKKDLLD